MKPLVLLRGGGDLASGVALRLHRAGLQMVITELPEPLTVRRTVAFSQAVYDGQTCVEGAAAQRVETIAEAEDCLQRGLIAVMVDPAMKSLAALKPAVLVDGRMTKRPPEFDRSAAPLVIGLGPGFIAGENCHAVIETRRGHTLGRVIWQGAAEADTGRPEKVLQYESERVLRAPADGILTARVAIGGMVKCGDILAEVNGQFITAPFDGVVRGLVQPGIRVKAGVKVGDVDPRCDPSLCELVSDKALSIGGGALEAILSRRELIPMLWRKPCV
ncbi:MAG TPA: selenium-dependent molybdenum cofactor biosynthesis protein YqeB [Anaerolineaceae bacterium]|nr:selenium-dependent molybdenum cofactor biosynthesis protein YqeB [Anaerolineaceae bacterium]HPN50579.1 selenium-dependent molybdenum cofactor biosynthesis protein YqeB [Anaerolineaceae bacterium]